jgi:hypothetical protein
VGTGDVLKNEHFMVCFYSESINIDTSGRLPIVFSLNCEIIWLVLTKVCENLIVGKNPNIVRPLPFWVSRSE